MFTIIFSIPGAPCDPIGYAGTKEVAVFTDCLKKNEASVLGTELSIANY